MKSIGGHTALVVAMEWKRELVVKVFHLHLFIRYLGKILHTLFICLVFGQ